MVQAEVHLKEGLRAELEKDIQDCFSILKMPKLCKEITTPIERVYHEKTM
jgi:hypothetical protein